MKTDQTESNKDTNDYSILEIETQGSQPHKRFFLLSTNLPPDKHLKFGVAQTYAIVPLCSCCCTHMRLSQITSGDGTVKHAWHCINLNCNNQVIIP